MIFKEILPFIKMSYLMIILLAGTHIWILYDYYLNKNITSLEKAYFQRSLSSMTYIYLLYINNKYYDFKNKTLFSFIFYSMAIVALIASGKYFLNFAGFSLFAYAFTNSENLLWNFYTTSLVPDYNMFSLGIIIGIMSFHFKSNKKKIDYLFWAVLIFTLIFTGSRRGFLFFISYSFIGILIGIKNGKIKHIIFHCLPLIFLSSIITIHLLPIFKLNFTNTNFDKKKFITFFPCPTYRYITILDRSININHIRQNISYQFFNGTTPPEITYNLFPSDGNRFKYWSLAAKIWLHEYSTFDKIFGKGFWYHDGRKLGIEYPHNLFLSKLLSLGIIGLTCTLLLIIICLYKCIFPIFQPDLLITLIVILFFTTISADSIFRTPVLTIIIMYPLLPTKKDYLL